jgi:hypothetical protein
LTVPRGNAILREIGRCPEQIAALRKDGILAGSAEQG